VNSLPNTVTRPQFEPGPSAPESSTLSTRLPSHPSFADSDQLMYYLGQEEWSNYSCHRYVKSEGSVVASMILLPMIFSANLCPVSNNGAVEFLSTVIKWTTAKAAERLKIDIHYV